MPFGFLEFGITDLVETLIIAFVLFYLYKWIRGSYAIQAAAGLIILILINALVSVLGFTTINFILRSILDVGILAIFIIFQPEIRKLLYNLGQNTSLDRFFSTKNEEGILDEIIDAVKEMSKTKTGALIVFARSSTLQDMVDAGVQLDAKVNNHLLVSIFRKSSPLHDGAVIIRNNRITAASCYLPISQNPKISQVYGTRHRAAVGITETNNVFVVVVSEETSRISIAQNGVLTSGLSIQKLRSEMQEEFGKRQKEEQDSGFTTGKDSSELSVG